MKMKRIATSIALAVLIAGGSYGSASAKTFKNCTELKKVYKNGVAKSKASAGNSNAHISSAIYLANKSKDRDKDGIVCES